MNSVDRRPRKYLTPDEIKALLEAARDGATRNPERDYSILVLLYHHGLRVSELCDLRLTDIDLGANTLYVRHQKSGTGGRAHPSLHPLFKQDLSPLRNWLKIRADMQLDHQFLFTSERRTRLDRRTVWKMLEAVGEAAGLAHLKPHPHALRHACGYTLINKDIPIRTVQSFLGHRSIQTTVGYTELAPNRFDKIKW
jgi:type 1 fimbriae regulatory protein FimB